MVAGDVLMSEVAAEFVAKWRRGGKSFHFRVKLQINTHD